MWAVQICMFAFSAVAAFLLRFDFRLPSASLRPLACALSIWIAVKIVVFGWLKLDRGFWRYVSVVDLLRVALGNCVASIVGCVLIVWIGPAGFPRSVYALDLIICFLATSGLRLAVRMSVEGASSRRNIQETEKRTLIYGAGDAGTMLLREIRNNPKLTYCVVGFVDDRSEKTGLRIQGIQVLGSGHDIEHLIEKHNVEIVLIAIPSASGTEMTRILSACHRAAVPCKTVPGLGEIIKEGGLANQIRDVAVEDLLGRTPIRLEEKLIRDRIEGKVILVTGAAGSIGSELCRQIARFHPAGIVGFEVAESPLFEVNREMRNRFPRIAFYPEIGGIQNRARVDEVLSRYKPSAIFHAAAYKHVPLMEEHVFEAIENNVFGTWNVAVAAKQQGVEDFVLISSDKAVRPTSVMGATKRIAELILLSLQNGGTQYVAVRCGNVLGSSGSVIPIFKRQIAAGGPVTVTHPEMRRFFMTIPEACQLMLQAAAIGEGGQICMLDMGQPVRIVDLARNLIRLSGLRPDEDVKIEFTGIRPGEKLCEDLSSFLENTVPTHHRQIRIFVGNGLPAPDLEKWLDTVHAICEARDVGGLVLAVKELVPDYSPSADLLKRMTQPRVTEAISCETH